MVRLNLYLRSGMTWESQTCNTHSGRVANAIFAFIVRVCFETMEMNNLWFGMSWAYHTEWQNGVS